MTTLKRYTGSAWEYVGAPSGTPVRYGVKAKRTTGQSINNTTWTTVQWDAADEFDDDTMHDPASNNTRITATTGGTFVVFANIGFANNGTGFRIAGFRKNGSGAEPTLGTATLGSPGAGTDAVLSLTVPLVLTAGDYLEVMVYQNSGGALNTTTFDGAPSFGMWRIGT